MGKGFRTSSFLNIWAEAKQPVTHSGIWLYKNMIQAWPASKDRYVENSFFDGPRPGEKRKKTKKKKKSEKKKKKKKKKKKTKNDKTKEKEKKKNYSRGHLTGDGEDHLDAPTHSSENL